MKVVLIPAYEPDGELVSICNRLYDEGFYVLVVNDGSGACYDEIFNLCKPYATVIKHYENRGKGAALKTGMGYIRENIDAEYFITCDADGQHRAEDVLRVAEQLEKGNSFVLTMREIKKDAPFRSKFGNSLSRVVYTLLSNRYLEDNQSGLRGFAIKHIDWLIKVEKDNYDYEMNVLYYAAKKGIKITSVPIEAIYIEGNVSSHFKPVTDTVRIYKSLFTRGFGSFIAFILAEIAVLISSLFLGNEWLLISIPFAGALNCITNIMLNKYVFFKSTVCYDLWNTLIYTVIYYIVYTFASQLVTLLIPDIWLFFAFNTVFITCIPLKYYLHKFISVASRTKN